MTLDHLMTASLVTVSPDETLEHVRSLFERHRFHHLLVVEPGREGAGRLVGLLSDRDLLKNLSPFIGKASERTQDSFLLQRKAHQVMSRRLVTAGPATPVKDAVILMLSNGVDCLPVVDAGGACVGIVTTHDVMRYLLECGVEPGCRVGRAA